MRLRELGCRLKRSVEAGIGWNGIGMAMSIALVVTAFVFLCVMVRDVGIGRIFAAIMATPPRAVLAACGLVCVGYCTLTLYDYLALRAIGRHQVPYTTAGLAVFAAYGIGHGIGMTLLTGNAVRLRIYSEWGLAVLPGTAAAVTRLPAWANQVLGPGLDPLMGRWQDLGAVCLLSLSPSLDLDERSARVLRGGTEWRRRGVSTASSSADARPGADHSQCARHPQEARNL